MVVIDMFRPGRQKGISKGVDETHLYVCSPAGPFLCLFFTLDEKCDHSLHSSVNIFH